MRAAPTTPGENVMRTSLLEILRCPSCAGSFSIKNSLLCPGPEREQILDGVLRCECTVYPVVAGIPILDAGPAAREATRRLEAARRDQALYIMLGLEGPRREWFAQRMADGRPLTFRQGVRFFADDPEGDYLLYRFSDPTYRVSEVVVRLLAAQSPCFVKPALDLCGGTGHLTRVLCQISAASPVILADLDFWKLWLGQRINAPDCLAVCCDAENPLPFRSEAFSLVICSDALHYLRKKEPVAREIGRVSDMAGALALTHLHNAGCVNFSPGMPLSLAMLRSLFRKANGRVFKESELLNTLLSHRELDLEHRPSDTELQAESAWSVIATRAEGFFRKHKLTAPACRPACLSVNPLYRIEHEADKLLLQLQFPSKDYELEFESCRRYLPEKVELKAQGGQNFADAFPEGASDDLVQRGVLLDLPPHYL
jgi:SAM-dependent methyltransferase